MTWKDVLKAHCGTEKMGCGCSSCEKQEMEKLVGNQKRIDADKDGKITGKDFAILREKSDSFEKFISRGFKFLDNSVKLLSRLFLTELSFKVSFVLFLLFSIIISELIEVLVVSISLSK